MFKKVLSILLIFACLLSFSVVFADEVQSSGSSSTSSVVSQIKQAAVCETVGGSVYDITQYKWFWDPIKVVGTKTVSFRDPWKRIFSYRNDTPNKVKVTITQTYTVTNSTGGSVTLSPQLIQAQLGVNVNASVTRTYTNTVTIPPNTTFYLEAAGTGRNIYFDVYVPHLFDSGYDYEGSGWVKEYTGISFWGHY
ncbi:hypothetical protein Calkro_0055 [Caldicellulosiruptor kronotskyensis 2002]|uniref:Uncharacterized protein n=1 Tax=Caldicellulosiruptor kronotskyensis (strain DSM 18902 / VKM B-2412 / 2002) TaxID=632348 RepID=E4SCB7_CALK2|nr:DUF6426 family protein [Caldicellulosiruptor kronotskyensis]ADQ44972.1 hypothetical protein Calkro_0055 [Caldicellulosiruptor kronotskyensis 2002]